MLKRMMLLPLAVLLSLPLRAQSQKAEADSVYEFLFVPGKDVFFIPYKDNLPEMQRLSLFVEQYRQEITDGRLPLRVDGYCSSLPGTKANLAVAKLRSNRVKSELILHNGLREEHFITHNHAEGGNFVTVRVIFPETQPEEENPSEVSQPSQPEVTAEQTYVATPSNDAAATTVMPCATVATKTNSLAVRANLLRWATLTPDLGIEWQFANKWSVVVDGSWTSWSWDDRNRRYALWEVSPEVRYYLAQNNRFYLGAQYKIGEFNYKLCHTGKQGDLQGGGITFGYNLPIGKSLALDFNAAAGCLHAGYETYHVIDGVRVKEGDHSKNVWGLTDLGVTLIWIIK